MPLLQKMTFSRGVNWKAEFIIWHHKIRLNIVIMAKRCIVFGLSFLYMFSYLTAGLKKGPLCRVVEPAQVRVQYFCLLFYSVEQICAINLCHGILKFKFRHQKSYKIQSVFLVCYVVFVFFVAVDSQLKCVIKRRRGSEGCYCPFQQQKARGDTLLVLSDQKACQDLFKCLTP